MIDFIPLEHYSRVYYYMLAAFIGCLAIMLVRHPKAVIFHSGIHNNIVRALGWVCVASMLLLLGLRPISYAFGDMGNYYKQFVAYQSGEALGAGDYLFELAMWFFARYLNAPLFFFTCFTLYIIPLVIALRKLLGVYWPLGFFLFAAHFDFYGYGVNGIRQGIASSLFLYALTLRPLRAWLVISVAIGIHASLVVPAIAYALTFVIRAPAHYFAGWSLCLIATIASPAFGEQIMSSGLGGGRLDQYVDVGDWFLEQFSRVGFRLDFLIYSLPPIVLGYYLVMVRKIADQPYLRILQVYLAANAVWLLMIRTPTSNRIAYLSWFLMGFLVAYPLIRHRIFKGQHLVYVSFLLVFFGYTFYRNL